MSARANTNGRGGCLSRLLRKILRGIDSWAGVCRNGRPRQPFDGLRTKPSVYVAHSRSLASRACRYAYHLRCKGYEVSMPVMVENDEGERKIFVRNLAVIRTCREFHVLYDGASQGIGPEVGAALALGKRVVVVKLDRPAVYGLLEEIQAVNDGQ